MTREEKQKKLEEIAGQVAKCTRCSLYKGAAKPVPGKGNPEAEVMFIGEAPGYHEDQKGIPFCGAAGNLLDKLLASIDLPREKAFIGNMVKHRPPGNRDPLPEEIEACQPFLGEQIKTINPKIIVTLGRFSLAKFLPGEKISQIHGQARFAEFNGKRYIVIPMYHPAAALRSGTIMEEAKEDFGKIKMFLEGGGEIEGAREETKEPEEKQMRLL